MIINNPDPDNELSLDELITARGNYGVFSTHHPDFIRGHIHKTYEYDNETVMLIDANIAKELGYKIKRSKKPVSEGIYVLEILGYAD